MRIAVGSCGLVVVLIFSGCSKSGSDSAAGSSTTTPGGWKEFAPEPDKFSIKLPGDPAQQPNPEASKSKGWGLDAGNLNYSIRYTELSDPSIEQLQNKIDEYFNDFADTLPITDQIAVEETKPISFAGVSGSEIDGTTIDKKSKRIRICIAGGRFYRADVTGTKEAVGSPDAEVFFNSFKIARQAPGTGG